jgi:hypothetical protein
MSLNLTEAQARALGLKAPKTPSKRKKGMARAGAVTRCVECGATFTGDAAETRHLNETRHARYEGVNE